MRPRTVPGILHYIRTHMEVFGFRPPRVELGQQAFDEAVRYQLERKRTAEVQIADDGARTIEINGVTVACKPPAPLNQELKE